ncbi:MAG TPA: replicative DNA helicase [Phycisphaerae bacterium]|jgi:replicative DNA helicase|nr:replicative DNA helicase [Phycisphaerae bacterium]HPC22945.1 replicative DNA helicase [Phycisphaerae bacterium]HRS29035.1 replicative DNA helicase [Phycisphaerae bacterium]HRT42870.1 replicative DNA helicase [Phycisphaerae bacterium]
MANTRRSREQPPREPSRPDSRPFFDRALPHDDDAERALLGSMLLEKEAIGEAITVLRDAGAAALDSPRNQRLFEVLVALYVENRPIDGVVLREELTRRGWWEDLGGHEYLVGLVNAVPSALRVRYYAQIVLEKYLLRELIGATHKVMEAAYADERPAKETLDYAEKEIFAVTERRVSGEAAPLDQLMRDVIQTLKSQGEGVLTGEPTGFIKLDELTCGLQPAELIIVAGRPSMGKTALGLNIAEHLAIVENRPVLFFSLEMSRQQVAQRVLCSQARVNAHQLRRQRRSAADLRLLEDFAQRLEAAPLYVDDTSDLSILEMRARARMAYRKHKIRAVFVDYLQLMHVPGSESRQVEVATISRGLKALAKDLNVPVVAMAQLNRNPEDKTRKGNRPRMSDLRESGAIEQDADVIALLHRESYYKSPTVGEDEEAGGVPDPEENLADLIIAKNRNGPVGDIKLHFSREYTRFDNHDPRPREPYYTPAGSQETPF